MILFVKDKLDTEVSLGSLASDILWRLCRCTPWSLLLVTEAADPGVSEEEAGVVGPDLPPYLPGASVPMTQLITAITMTLVAGL